MTRSALIVDDDPDFARLLSLHLQAGGGCQSEHVASAERALAALDRTVYDVVLTDLHMPPGLDGLELIRRAHAQGVDAPFIVLTGQATVETAVQAMRDGAFDYLRKSASGDELRASVARAIDHGRMVRELARLRREVDQAVGADVARPIGESAVWKRTLALAERVAASDASVLLLGESGTGKELLARAIHRFGARAGKPFVAFDCSALSPSLVESELFGHEKGAFTGAQRARRGLFREASGGTLFLDEIGDIAPELQNKLLRVLQEREIKPVGADDFTRIDVRLLAATNKDLKKLAEAGRFREDLYYRLAVVPIELPPLRDRKEDLPLLAAHFLRRRAGRAHHGAAPHDAGPGAIRIEPEALERLRAYPWPGNIRELENVLERAAILSDGETIRARDLPPLADEGGARHHAAAAAATPDRRPLKELLDETIERVERQAIRAALEGEGGSPSKAARRLGISRAAFYNKVKRHGILL